MKTKIALAAAFVIFASLLVSFTDSSYFKIIRAFDIFSGAFKELSNNYVLEIDPDEMVKNGIEGMLSTLDPYTVYYDSNNDEDLQIMTNGSYAGFGFTISYIDGMTTIVGVREGYSAYKEGIRVGDKILSIDSNIVLNLNNDQIRQYTKGLPGVKSIFRVLRDGIKDTLNLILTRENINLPNVSYSGMLKNDIGYIKLDRFTRNSAAEVKSAVYKLKNQGNLRGLILDLRDNPGGLLASAVAICEIFVPKGSTVVSTRGKNKANDYEYKSMADPIEPDLPLAVVIDENSASASEVVAGAIQDLDRGIVVGRRSFGKGLVQSIFELPYKTSMKITTSKYYTPSGRCIQKIKYGSLHNKNEITANTDTTIFYTKNKRPVFELTGILPDSSVEDYKLPDALTDLYTGLAFFKFANEYSAKFEKIEDDFEVSDNILHEFDTYVKKNINSIKPQSISKLIDIEDIAKKNNYSAKSLNSIKALRQNIESEERKLFKNYKKDIAKVLKYEIWNRFFSESKIIEKHLPDDITIETAINLLISDKYSMILAGASLEKNVNN